MDFSVRVGAACVGAAATKTDMPDITVLMGPQGAGKGTQAHLLAERLKLPLVATGDILREMAHSDESLGLQVRRVQAAGQLVSDDILAEVVKTRLSRSDCEGGCVLDGFPRTLPQVKLLERIAEPLGHRITVISIEVPRELLFKRLAGIDMLHVPYKGWRAGKHAGLVVRYTTSTSSQVNRKAFVIWMVSRFSPDQMITKRQ